MAKVHCVILDADQMPKTKGILTDIRGKNAYLQLVQGSLEYTQGENVRLNIMNAENQAETWCGRVAKRDADELTLENFEMLDFKDKRDDVKVLINRPIYIILTDETGAMRKMSANLRDISAGGICVISKEDMPLNSQFEVVYDLAKGVDVLKVEVIHRRAMEDGSFTYGCRFVDIYFTQEHMVREFVFKRHLGLVGRRRVSA